MSVILTLEAKTFTQGTVAGLTEVTLTNSGNENVRKLRLKVTDSVVFSVLKVAQVGAPVTCLNQFNTNDIYNWTDANYNFPAGTTKTIKFNPFTIKGDAPVQIHNITCSFQYEVY